MMTVSKEMLWIGGLTAAVATGLYVLFGPSEKKRLKKKDLCPGLYNFGNTCFMNAVLQSMASCPSVTKWLRSSLQYQRSAISGSLSHTISETLEVLNNEGEETETHSPDDVMQVLRTYGWVISSYEEQDAHELFHILTQTFDEETSKYPRVVSLFDTGFIENHCLQYLPESEAITRSHNLLPVLPHKDKEHPFRGLLASQLHCNECGYRNPVRYDVFDSLSLSIPTSVWESKSLDGLLRHFVAMETVHNVECPGCAKIKYPKVNLKSKKIPLPRATFCKKLTIGKLPHCLCFHIQRTQWMNNGSAMKREEFISFPAILHMEDYVYNKQSKKDFNSSSLLGGANSILFRSNPRKTSGPVNLLRALNYDSNVTRNGIYIHCPSSPHSSADTRADVNHNAPNDSKFAHSDCSYKLSAVVVHLGDVMSGHFVTYRRSPATVKGNRKTDRWLYCSDSSVHVVPVEEVMAAQAYMLLYEKL